VSTTLAQQTNTARSLYQDGHWSLREDLASSFDGGYERLRAEVHAVGHSPMSPHHPEAAHIILKVTAGKQKDNHDRWCKRAFLRRGALAWLRFDMIMAQRHP
jgi:hypothetical protein